MSPFFEVYTETDQINLKDYLSISSFDYTQEKAKDNVLELRGTCPNIDVWKIIRPKIAEKSKIVFWFGFKDGSGIVQSITRIAIIAKTPKTKFGNNIYVSITATDKGVYMDKNNPKRSFIQKTASQIAQELADEWGLQTEIVETNYTYPIIVQGGLSDYAFIKKLAKESNREFWINDGKLYFVDSSYKRQDARLTLYWKQNSEDSYKINQLINCEFEQNEVTANPFSSEIRATTLDANNQVQTIAKTQPDNNINVGGSNDIKFDANAVKTPNQTTVRNVPSNVTRTDNSVITPPEKESELVNNQLSSKMANERGKILKMIFETPLNPNIELGDINTVAGTDYYEGNYEIIKVRHQIGTTNRTSGEASRTGLNQANRTNGTVTTSETNNTVGVDQAQVTQKVKVINFDENSNQKP